MYDYTSLKSHSNQGSGISDVLLFAPVSAFAASGIKEPTLTASPGTPTPGEEVTVVANHTFSSGEGFIELLCAPFVNKMMANISGETGSKKFLPRVEVVVPGSYATLHEFVKNALNEPCILLAKEGNCDAGFYYQIGTSCNYAWMESAEWDTGTTKDGRKGYKMTWEASASGILIYTGTITLKS